MDMFSLRNKKNIKWIPLLSGAVVLTLNVWTDRPKKIV